MKKKEAKSKPYKNDGLEAQVRRNTERGNKIKDFLEKMFNHDIDGDGVIGSNVKGS